MQIKNIIFDLGAVLYEIDPRRATLQFMELMPPGTADKFPGGIKDAAGLPVFLDLELGKLEADAFPAALRAETGMGGSDEEITAAWISLLVDVYPGRAEALRQLQKRYRMVLLSNTNVIHQKWLAPQCKSLFACLEEIFFSYEMGLRKPDPEIFLKTLSATKMLAAETLFVDDSLLNIEAADKVGLQTFWFEEGKQGRDWHMLMKQLAR